MTKNKNLKLFAILVLLIFLLGVIYRHSPYKIEYLGHYDKIWAHRVDSKEKLESSLKFFDGVELDLVYNAKTDILDVTHPPVKSINLSFKKYLTVISKDAKPYLWLDIKNLNQHNSDSILKKLVSLFSEKKYPFKKILVETRYPEALPNFAKVGFLTSYYLPSGLSEMDSIALKKEVYKIRATLAAQPKLAISSDYIDYELMLNFFPKTDKYLWVLTSLWKHGISQPRKILKDPNVKVVLVNYRAIKGNR